MKWIKFTNPNLIVFYLFVIAGFSLVLPVKKASAESSVQQITASRLPVDHSQWIHRFNIVATINKLKGNLCVSAVVPNSNSKLLLAQIVAKATEGKEPASVLSGNTEHRPAAIELMSTSDSVLREMQPTPVGWDTIDEAYSEKELVLSEAGDSSSEFYTPIGNETQVSTNDKDDNHSKANFYKRRNYVIYKIFGEEKLLALKSKMLNYGRSNFSGSTRIFFNSLVDHFFRYPIIIIFTFLIFFFLFHIFFVLLVLNYSTQFKNYNERYVRVYKDFYEKVTLAYLFDELDWDTYVSRLKKIDKHKNRKILISILLNFHDNLKGGFDKPISEIYTKLNLEQDSFKSIHSFLYNKKVSGLHELTNLYPTGAIKILPKLLNHSNASVRSEAQKAYILLHPEKPFEFLRTLNKSFSRWTQLSAFNLLRLPHLNVPSFSRYIRSKHHDVRVFCLQMIVYFQQLENVSLIFYVLKSHQELTRFLAYKAINDLRLYDGKAIMKNEYRYETERNKKEIVKALCNIGTDNDIDFLEIIMKSESLALQIEACRALYYMSPESKKRLMDMRVEVKSDIDLFVAHITDSRN